MNARNLTLLWKLRRLSYRELMKKEYDDSPETNKTILAMDYQLQKCIEELESALGINDTRSDNK